MVTSNFFFSTSEAFDADSKRRVKTKIPNIPIDYARVLNPLFIFYISIRDIIQGFKVYYSNTFSNINDKDIQGNVKHNNSTPY